MICKGIQKQQLNTSLPYSLENIASVTERWV